MKPYVHRRFIKLNIWIVTAILNYEHLISKTNKRELKNLHGK